MPNIIQKGVEEIMNNNIDCNNLNIKPSFMTQTNTTQNKEELREYIESFIERTADGQSIFAPVEQEDFDSFMAGLENILDKSNTTQNKEELIRKTSRRIHNIFNAELTKQTILEVEAVLSQLDLQAHQSGIEEERKRTSKDTERLDFLDKCNQALNKKYGTNYGWKLVLTHNVTRLMLNDYEGSVDLNDANGGNDKLKSCREAIDEQIKSLKENKQ